MKRFLLLSLVIAGFAVFSACNQPVKEALPVVVETTVELPKDAKRIAAIVTLKDEAFVADFEQAASAVVAGSRAEEGCIYYELGKSATPLTYAFIEVWKSQEAIDIHNETTHFNDFKNAVEGKADLTVCVTDLLY